MAEANEQDVEREANLVAADLHVPFFEHVEQADLDPLGQVGQLVYGEHATIGRGHQAVVQCELVGKVATFGHLDRIDLTDQVSDRGVGCRQLLAEAMIAMDPVDRGFVALLRDQPLALSRDRVVGVVVDLGAGDDRHPLVEQLGQGPDHPGLGLAPFSQRK